MSLFLIFILTLLLGVYNWVPGPWRSIQPSNPALPGHATHNPGELIFCLVLIILLAYAAGHWLG